MQGNTRLLQNALKYLKDVSLSCVLSATYASTKLKCRKVQHEKNIRCKQGSNFQSLKRQMDHRGSLIRTLNNDSRCKSKRRSNTSSSHETGYKADGNKKNEPCAKLPYMTISKCGQVGKNQEYLKKEKTKRYTEKKNR